mgnify:CR=1 FL=1
MRISSKQYASALYGLTQGKTKPEIEKSVADFARYIYKNRKLKLSEKIAEQFVKIFNKRNGIVEAEIITRKKMDETELKKARHFVKEKYGAKEVVLTNTIDESVKGGMILKVGDEIVDGSIKGRLAELRKVLTS